HPPGGLARGWRADDPQERAPVPAANHSAVTAGPQRAPRSIRHLHTATLRQEIVWRMTTAGAHCVCPLPERSRRSGGWRAFVATGCGPVGHGRHAYGQRAVLAGRREGTGPRARWYLAPLDG